MTNSDLLDLYAQYLNPLIIQGLQKLAGTRRAAAADEAAFRRIAVEPIWGTMPLPVRLLGRDAVHWDAYLLAARSEVFQTSAAGTLALHPDAAQRLSAVGRRVFSAQRAAPPAAPTSAEEEEIVILELVEEGPTGGSQPASQTAAGAAPADTSSGAAIGIDLGTTYSVVAHIDAHGRPASIPNAVGDIITPSVVLMDEGGTVVGKEAVQASAMEPEKVADCAKRDMGAKFYRKKLNGEFLPPEVISSIILRTLKGDAERKLGTVRDAVITVPAYFDEARRQATMDAGKIAGLNVLDIINEPTAAAIAYGYQVGFLDPRQLAAATDKPLRVLVYDLGGGTFDVTIVEIQGSSFKAIATDGDNALGGKDWDEHIVNFAADLFIAEHREDPRKNPTSLQELWLNAETAKKTLTERPRATMYVNHLGSRLKAEISRQQFEDATAPLLGRTRTTTEIVVRQAGLTWPAIDKVLLVGGSTRMPQVVRMLQELTGKAPERSISVDEAVAHGAALFANLLQLQKNAPAAKPQFSVTNVNSHSLGIIGVDTATGRRRNQIVIPKNTPLPHTVVKTFKIQKAGGGKLVIRVVEGESERPDACIQVGACTIQTPASVPAGTPVQVSYVYQSNGRLEVRAQIIGHDAAAVTVLEHEHTLSHDEADLWNRCFCR